MKANFIRKICGFITGLMGLCAIVTIDQSLKQANVKNKVVKGIGRYVTCYSIAAGTIWLSHKLFDEMLKLDEEEQRLSEEIDRDLENLDKEMEDLGDLGVDEEVQKAADEAIEKIFS